MTPTPPPTLERLTEAAVRELIDLEDEVFNDHCLPAHLRAIVLRAVKAAAATS
jgi:hypothetical protein